VDLVLDVLLLLKCQAEDVRVLEALLVANALDMGLGCFNVVKVLGVGVEYGFCSGGCLGDDFCRVSVTWFGGGKWARNLGGRGLSASCEVVAVNGRLWVTDQSCTRQNTILFQSLQTREGDM